MSTMKTLNGFEIVDAKAREDIEILKKSGGGGGGSADLSNYYTKDETYSKTEIDNKGYLTDLPEHTHDEYLTEHQSLDNYYTKSETYSKTEVDNAIANIPGGGSGGPTPFTFKCTKDSNITEEEVSVARDVIDYIRTNNKASDKYILSMYTVVDTGHVGRYILDVASATVEVYDHSYVLNLDSAPFNNVEHKIYNLRISLTPDDYSVSYVGARWDNAPFITDTKLNSYATKKYVDDAISEIEVPTDDHINSLIDTKLGVIENGTY